MTSELPPPFGPNDLGEISYGTENPLNFFLPPTDRLHGLQLLNGILRRNEFSDEEMFEAIATVVTVFQIEEFQNGNSAINLSQHNGEYYSQIALIERNRMQTYGFSDFERDIGLERTVGDDLVERNENAHILFETEEKPECAVDAYYDLDRDIDGFVKTYRTEWVFQETDEGVAHSSTSVEWKMPMDQKNGIVQRLKEYLQHSTLQLQPN